MNNDLIIFSDTLDEDAIKQIHSFSNHEAFKNSKIRIMPDVHAGKNCVVGFTATIDNMIIPSVIGSDIGCGMFCANLGQVNIDYDKLDKVIRNRISEGSEKDLSVLTNFPFEELKTFKRLKRIKRIKNSIGTLGNGNHFIEIDEDEIGNKYLIIHTGSRNLGTQVAENYQTMADLICNHDYLQYLRKTKEVISKYKALGREKEIERELLRLKNDMLISNNYIPFELAYLTDEYKDDYLNDMKICQSFAILNRYTIASAIAGEMGFSIDDYFESIHNYISINEGIIRKGAISAKSGERVIIPMNMRDGCIIGIGKGNNEWNQSAPHGAGRLLSRSEARKQINLDDYIKSMQNVYTTSVNKYTIDESPFAYKPMDEITEKIGPSVEIKRIIKPVYNYKSNK